MAIKYILSFPLFFFHGEIKNQKKRIQRDKKAIFKAGSDDQAKA